MHCNDCKDKILCCRVEGPTSNTQPPSKVVLLSLSSIYFSHFGPQFPIFAIPCKQVQSRPVYRRRSSPWCPACRTRRRGIGHSRCPPSWLPLAEHQAKVLEDFTIPYYGLFLVEI